MLFFRVLYVSYTRVESNYDCTAASMWISVVPDFPSYSVIPVQKYHASAVVILIITFCDF